MTIWKTVKNLIVRFAFGVGCEKLCWKELHEVHKSNEKELSNRWRLCLQLWEVPSDAWRRGNQHSFQQKRPNKLQFPRYYYIPSPTVFPYLFRLQSLPHYIPKLSPIIFECILGDELIKEIELSNPTQRVINYWVSYDGSLDFSINNAGNPDHECVVIQPK